MEILSLHGSGSSSLVDSGDAPGENGVDLEVGYVPLGAGQVGDVHGGFQGADAA